MVPNTGHLFALFEGDVAEFIMLLAVISVASWVLVAATVVLRFGAHFRYKRLASRLLKEEQGDD
jgi:hypothetical protein